MPAHFTEIKIMLERHGTFTIARETAKGHEDLYNVMNDVTGHVRWFPTLQQCRQYIGVERSPGPHWTPFRWMQTVRRAAAVGSAAQRATLAAYSSAPTPSALAVQGLSENGSARQQ